MAHFAQLNADNVVLQVIVVSNNELLDDNNDEQESLGRSFCQEHFGGTWVQTSYNRNIRKNYACIGDTYDSVRDAFIPEKPFASWILNETTCLWFPPEEYPDDGKEYEWNEETTSWVERE